MSIPNAFEVAEAVAVEVSGLLPDVEVKAVLIPELDLGKIDTATRIFVVPASQEAAPNDRASDLLTMAIDIGIQRRLDGRGDTDIQQVKSMLGLVSQITQGMSRRMLQAQPNVRYRTAAIDPLWLPGHLVESRVFTSVLTLTYSIVAPVGA